MKIRDLIPWSKDDEMDVMKSDLDPFYTLQRDMNRLFDGFSRSLFDLSPMRRSLGSYESLSPRVDVTESDKEVVVTAEIPGMDEKDIEVIFSNDVLTLKGEKKREKEDKSRGYYQLERAYGAFHRAIPIPTEINPDKVNASFKNGVLTVKLEKSENAQKHVRKIPINGK
ncbi:MAG: Hsp20/alpha crystallin family protein [Nitrospinales bacterium]